MCSLLVVSLRPAGAAGRRTELNARRSQTTSTQPKNVVLAIDQVLKDIDAAGQLLLVDRFEALKVQRRIQQEALEAGSPQGPGEESPAADLHSFARQTCPRSSRSARKAEPRRCRSAIFSAVRRHVDSAARQARTNARWAARDEEARRAATRSIPP